jgi:hypothetical protein
MLEALRGWGDRLLGRGSAAITVPVMDGALKANRLLDDAEVLASLPGIDDLASDGQALHASAGPCVYRLDGGRWVEVTRVDGDVTAIAAAPGRLAIAIGGSRVSVREDAAGRELARLDMIDGRPALAINALAFEGADALVLSDGSARRRPDEWCRDLMEHGDSGRVIRWRFDKGGGKGNANGATEPIASGQRHAFGVLPLGDAVVHSESWRHRLVVTDARGAKTLLAELPGYPSRMVAASDGGLWLSCFVCRTQLVEFVLREDAYRRRMLDEIDPRYWIAPALSSGRNFLEPLQGAGVKTMGVLKPWAPPRSYGLVLKVTRDGRIAASAHSQVDGQHHGVTAIAEFGGALMVASKGRGRLLRVALPLAGASSS